MKLISALVILLCCALSKAMLIPNRLASNRLSPTTLAGVRPLTRFHLMMRPYCSSERPAKKGFKARVHVLAPIEQAQSFKLSTQPKQSNILTMLILLATMAALISQSESFSETIDPLEAFSSDWDKVAIMLDNFETISVKPNDDEALDEWKQACHTTVSKSDLKLLTKYVLSNHITSSNVWYQTDLRKQFNAHILTSYLAKSSQNRSKFLSHSGASFKEHLAVLIKSNFDRELDKHVHASKITKEGFIQVYEEVLEKLSTRMAKNGASAEEITNDVFWKTSCATIEGHGKEVHIALWDLHQSRIKFQSDIKELLSKD